ncbi:MAG: hypothetical protein GTO16_09935 [Candidatus Aminicenantes bacterium]|nr:hypothetical protein [Candidatus Aminicenantes bacterium]
MKISYIFLVVCLVFTFGCAAMAPERGVRQDNIFYSTALPKMGVKISPDFEYIGKAEEKERGKDISGRREHSGVRESYLFGYIEGGKIKKGVIIRIQTIVAKTAFWVPDIFGRVENKLDSGTVKIEGKTYQYVVVASSGIGRKYERDFISSKGYIVPNAFLVKVLGRISGHDDEILTHIVYFEDISHKYSRRDLIDKYTLSNEQKSFLEAFIDRHEKNIQLGKVEVKKEIVVQEKAPKEIAPKEIIPQERADEEIASKEMIAQEKVAKKIAPIATPIDKVVIGVLDFQVGGKSGGADKLKKALIKELGRNTTVKLVDIHEANSLSDLKKFEYLRAEQYGKYYKLDMILHTHYLGGYNLMHDSDNYFNLIDLYTKRVKEVHLELKGPISLRYRGICSKVLVSEDLNRVLREKRKAAGK